MFYRWNISLNGGCAIDNKDILMDNIAEYLDIV